MAKVKVRSRSKTLYDSLRQSGLKKKKAARVANSFDAYGRDARTVQRREAGRRGGRATAKKTSPRRTRRTTVAKRGTRKR